MFESRLIHPVRNLELDVLRLIPAQIFAMTSCIEQSLVSDIGRVTRQKFGQYLFMLGSLVKCKIIYAFFTCHSASGGYKQISMSTAQGGCCAIVGRMWLSTVRCAVRSKCDHKLNEKRLWSEIRDERSEKCVSSRPTHIVGHTSFFTSFRFSWRLKFSIQIRPNNECFQSDEYCPLWRSWNLCSLKFSSLLFCTDVFTRNQKCND